MHDIFILVNTHSSTLIFCWLQD